MNIKFLTAMLLVSCTDEPIKIIAVNSTQRPETVAMAPSVEVEIEAESPIELELFSYTTEFKNKPNRTKNITLIADKINNLTLFPSDKFSFNKFVGARTEERGYLPAPTYVMGMVVQDVGGGACQVSSTLYAVATHIDLQILDRRPHSRASSYIPHGLDATVNYPKECWKEKQDRNICFDLVIRNNYLFPITFRTEIIKNGEFNSLTISANGIKRLPASITSEWKLSGTPPFKIVDRKIKWQKNNKRKLKQLGKPGMSGYRIYTFKFPDGRIEKRKVYSRYRPVNEIWFLGADYKSTPTP